MKLNAGIFVGLIFLSMSLFAAEPVLVFPDAAKDFAPKGTYDIPIDKAFLTVKSLLRKYDLVIVGQPSKEDVMVTEWIEGPDRLLGILNSTNPSQYNFHIILESAGDNKTKLIVKPHVMVDLRPAGRWHDTTPFAVNAVDRMVKGFYQAFEASLGM